MFYFRIGNQNAFGTPSFDGGRLRKTKRDPNRSVEEEILGYFLRNPAGADTLEGIAHWRLFDEVLYRSIEETNRAVSSLVSHGLLIKDSSLPLSKSIYRLDIKKRQQAERYLRKLGKAPARQSKKARPIISPGFGQVERA
jgi:hypothetical protein